MAKEKLVRVKITRETYIHGTKARAGELFDVSEEDAKTLVKGVKRAEYAGKEPADTVAERPPIVEPKRVDPKAEAKGKDDKK